MMEEIHFKYKAGAAGSQQKWGGGTGADTGYFRMWGARGMNW